MKNLTNIIIMLYGKTIIKNNLRLLSRDYLIILVENGKERGEKYVGKNFENIKNPENLGFAGGCNVGIEWAIKKGAEYVFLLNQDAWVEDGCIEKLIKRAEAHPEVGILGPVILTGDKLYGAGGEIDKKRFTAGLIDYNKPVKKYKDTEVDFVSGTAMLIKTEVLEKTGLFDEKFFLYYEDVDLCIRAWKAHYKCLMVGEAIVYHEPDPVNPNKEYYLARNHFLFLEKHAPLQVKVREMVRLPKTLWEHYRKKEYNSLLGIRDYFLRHFGEK